MEGITLGQVAIWVAFAVALITGIKYLISNMKSGVTALFRDEFKSLDEKFKSLGERMEKLENKIGDVETRMGDKIDRSNMGSCKNFIVGRISKIENGESLSEIEAERFWEEYDFYIKHKGNSYIKNKVEQLQKEGKL